MGSSKAFSLPTAVVAWLVCTGSQLQAETPPTPTAAKPFEGPIVADDVRKHIHFLASPELRGRSGDDARKAAEYIKVRFQKWGLRPLFAKDDFFQEIPGKENDDGSPNVMGRNIGAYIPGSDPNLKDEFVIVGTHHDHLGIRNGKIYRGADDNASGVSMMLEVARNMAAAKIKPKRSMVFVGFDLEERMLWGSRWFAAHPPWPMKQVKLFITADMIGRSLGNLDLPTVFVLGSEHAPSLRTALDKIGTPKGLETARLGIDLVGTRSDYGPFRDRKVPFLFFSTGQNSDYHTPRDVPERIDYDKVAGVSSLVLKLCLRVADAEKTPQWTDEVETSLDEPKAVLRIAKLLEQAGDDYKLTAVQAALVSHVKNKTKQIIKRGKMTAAERTWLTRMSQLMLLSVF